MAPFFSEYGSNIRFEGDDADNASCFDGCVDKPYGEQGWRTRDGRPGWGTADILVTINITKAQYVRYMCK